MDLYLVKTKLVPSRTKAQELIQDGRIQIISADGFKRIAIFKSETLDTDQTAIVLENKLLKYVSRGGVKLEGALEYLRIDVAGYQVLDVGQSTGGFTDCLLQKGAQKIVGIDVGTAQLHSQFQNHPQVLSYENFHLDRIPSLFSEGENSNLKFDLVVIDLSFISVNSCWSFLKNRTDQILALVKPQFEVGKSQISKSGMVKNRDQYLLVQKQTFQALEKFDFEILDYFPSLLEGRDGNQEFFLYARRIRRENHQ